MVTGFYYCYVVMVPIDLPISTVFWLIETAAMANAYCYPLWSLGCLSGSDDFTCSTPGKLIINKNVSLWFKSV